MSLITGTISSLKTTGDITKSLINLKSISDVRDKVIELQSVIMDAQSSAIEANTNQLLLVEKITILKEKIAQMKTWDSEKQRYKLISLWNDAVVYSLKKSMKGAEPPHWICANCYEKGERSIIQKRTNLKNG